MMVIGWLYDNLLTLLYYLPKKWDFYNFPERQKSPADQSAGGENERKIENATKVIVKSITLLILTKELKKNWSYYLAQK